MKPEIWLPIENFEGWYLASTYGQIQSLDRYIDYIVRGKPARRFSKGRILKPGIASNGYPTVNLCKENIQNYCIHILIAKTFIPNPDNLPEVNHIDLNKQNNHIDNLEWITSSGNRQHAYDTGAQKPIKSKDVWTAKLKEEDIPNILLLLEQGVFQRIIAKQYNVSREAIRDIKLNKHWKEIKRKIL